MYATPDCLVQAVEFKAMKLGEHSIIQPVLADILEENATFLHNYVVRHGVEATSAEDLIHEVYLTMCGLEPRGEVETLLRDLESVPLNRRENEDTLRQSLTALFVYYLRLKCLDYLRRRRWQQERLTPLKDETQNEALLVFEDRDLRRFLFDVGLLRHLDVSQLEQGNLFMTLRFWELLADKAGLNERERDFILFRVKHPNARDQDFDPALRPYTISRLKHSALIKIVRFLR